MQSVRCIVACCLVAGFLPGLAVGQQAENRYADLEQRIAALEARLNADELIATVYERLQPSVVRIHSGLAHGTGFFVDVQDERFQYLVTNDHVINDPARISVLVDSTMHVRAQLVAADPSRDLAVIRIRPLCTTCASLNLATESYLDSALAPGRRVFAIGFPLHQQKTLTSGIVSNVTSTTVMSDVVLNPGNSGGPLLTTDGVVIAINTFIDQATVGPGISGSMLMRDIDSLLALAKAVRPDSLLNLGPLPVISGAYPLETLREFAELDSIPEVYKDFAGIDGNRFSVTVMTPIMHVMLANEIERQVTHDRRRRENRAGIPSTSRYQSVEEYRDWLEHVGDVTRPAVSIQVTPKIGETSGSMARGFLSAFTSGLSGTYVPRDVTIRFRGDVWDVEIFKSRVPIDPYIGGVRPIKINRVTRLLNMQDLATEGLYILPPEIFEPDIGGIPAGISLLITDLKNQDSTWVSIPEHVAAQIWNDFIPYFQSQADHKDIKRAEIVRDFVGIGMLFDLRYTTLVRPILTAGDAVGHESVGYERETDRIVMYFRPTGSLRRIRVVIRSAGVVRSNVWVATEDGDEESKLLAEVIREAVEAMRLNNPAPSR